MKLTKNRTSTSRRVQVHQDPPSPGPPGPGPGSAPSALNKPITPVSFTIKGGGGSS